MGALLELTRRFSAEILPEAPAEPTAIREALRRTERILGGGHSSVPATPALLDSHDRLVRLFRETHSLEQARTIDLRRAPWMLFEAPGEGRPALAETPGFLQALIDSIRQRQLTGAILPLADAFLLHFPSQSRHFPWLCETLPALLESGIPHLRIAILLRRHREFRLFSVAGPELLARRLLASSRPQEVMEEAGFVDLLEASAFLDQAIGHLLEGVERGLDSGEFTEQRLQDLLSFLSAEEGDGLRFASHRALTAESLILPFTRQTGGTLHALRQQVHTFIDRHYGHPRLSPANWQNVSELARQTALQWYLRRTLDEFFHIVRKGSESHKTADLHWRYREAFWRAYLDKGVIEDAWIVLGPAFRDRLRHYLERSEIEYGSLQKGYLVQPTHAVLILGINDLVITEWNFNGKYRLWPRSDPNAPEFYRKDRPYTRNDLVHMPAHEGSHHGSAHGTWQRKLADLIERHTSIHLHTVELMPHE